VGLNNETNYRFEFVKKIYKSKYDVIIILVVHDIFKKMGLQKIKNLTSNKNCFIMDIKSIFPKKQSWISTTNYFLIIIYKINRIIKYFFCSQVI
jgi:UDP-N-acetyl-D-mannosaminuronate dehydrogenase